MDYSTTVHQQSHLIFYLLDMELFMKIEGRTEFQFRCQNESFYWFPLQLWLEKSFGMVSVLIIITIILIIHNYFTCHEVRRYRDMEDHNWENCFSHKETAMSTLLNWFIFYSQISWDVQKTLFDYGIVADQLQWYDYKVISSSRDSFATELNVFHYRLLQWQQVHWPRDSMIIYPTHAWWVELF